jgi:phospholipid/cholesterol/gamma-HCH transport system substrate-binding protein
VELSYKQEVSVGVLVLAGLIVFAFGMFWFTGRSVTAGGVRVEAVFTNVGGLKVGDPVHVSGVKKGRVAGVRLERVGRVVVTLELADDVRPHADAAAAVASADFLGAKYVAYDPGSKPELLPEGKPIPGVTEGQFADIATGAATSARELIESINKGLNPGELAADIHDALVATQRGMEALTNAVNGPTVKQTQQTLAAVERVMARFDSVLGSTGAARTGMRLDSLSLNFNLLASRMADATASLKQMLDRMERGEGTFGKMATDTTLYRNMNEALTAISELLKDLKERPGRYLTVKVF